MDSRAKDGNDVRSIIQDETNKLVDKGITPKVIHIDSYSYYLLKDMLQRTGQKTTDGYKEVLKYNVGEHTLDVLIDPKSKQEGCISDKPEIIKVYGE
jgi:hypothetical protein